MTLPRITTYQIGLRLEETPQARAADVSPSAILTDREWRLFAACGRDLEQAAAVERLLAHVPLIAQVKAELDLADELAELERRLVLAGAEVDRLLDEVERIEAR